MKKQGVETEGGEKQTKCFRWRTWGGGATWHSSDFGKGMCFDRVAKAFGDKADDTAILMKYGSDFFIRTIIDIKLLGLDILGKLLKFKNILKRMKM